MIDANVNGIRYILKTIKGKYTTQQTRQFYMNLCRQWARRTARNRQASTVSENEKEITKQYLSKGVIYL